MKGKASWLLLALAPLSALAQEPAVAATPEPATACERWASPGLPEGPIGIGWYEADVVTGRRTCPRTELALGTRGGAVIDTPDFYGTIGLGLLLSGSYALGADKELFGTLELLQFQFVQNGTLKRTGLSLGQLTAGGSMVTFRRERLAGAATARLMLPTSTLAANVRTVGVEAGHSATFRPSERLELHGFVGADLSAGLSVANSYPRVGGLLTLGVQYSPLSWLGLVLNANGRLGATSYVAPAVGLRFKLYRGLGAELGVTLPLAGSDRHEGLFALRFGYRL